ncbi:hypothetical protein M427DRAFT_152807 [Gonapodya prolifera JEL478]|uniref:Uncharacterized protein n=1 Tax=Gonapodya prolifera (strain JEL478) TaxID=1344416 RepID=A0A139AQP0_GONPJ|nr:hypothetical protein M427DRAFT_152807 [Gonapodya prolifera JEL478]|eukprot:KXS18805.1 hypothetical protein M427DRAFT_152807 [Gonapodya prolifera JEL478]
MASSIGVLLLSLLRALLAPFAGLRDPANVASHVAKVFYTPIALIYMILNPSAVSSMPSCKTLPFLISLAGSILPVSFWAAERGWIAKMRWEMFETLVREGIKEREAFGARPSSVGAEGVKSKWKDTSSESTTGVDSNTPQRKSDHGSDANRLGGGVPTPGVMTGDGVAVKGNDEKDPPSLFTELDKRFKSWAWGKTTRFFLFLLTFIPVIGAFVLAFTSPPSRSPTYQLHRKYLKVHRDHRNAAIGKPHQPSKYDSLLDPTKFPFPPHAEYRAFDLPASLASAVPVLNLLIELAAAVGAAKWFLEVVDAEVPK